MNFDANPYLIDVYQGEVLGEAFFALLKERELDDERSARWQLLERLERHVKTRLRPELERRGLDTAEDPARVAEGRSNARAFSDLSAAEQTQGLKMALAGFVEQFKSSRDAAPAELRELATFVLQHEEALLDCATREDSAAVSAFLESTGAVEEKPLPQGMGLTPLDENFCRDPHPILRRLRSEAPVHRDRQFRRVILTRHDDVQHVLRDLSFWVDVRKSREDSYMRSFRDLAERDMSMLSLDDPEHKRLRNLVSGAFTPRAITTWQPIVQQVAKELVDAIEAQGDDEFDVVAAVGAPLPAIAIARLLGVDPAQQANFKAWSESSVEAGFNPLASDEQKAIAQKARDSLDACFTAEIAKRRESPSDDLIGDMVTASDEGDELTDREIVTMCNLLLVAGNVTTSDLIGNGMKALIEHPDQLELLRERPELLPNAVEEMLRFDPPVTQSGRLAPRDIEIGGVQIRQGESITTVLSAANRDPDVYPDPDRFDIEREDTHHQAFGGGAHLCLGAHLARLETLEAIGGLLARFPRLQRSERPFAYKRVPGFRGLAEYWVRIA